jgi:hypothetical protein
MVGDTDGLLELLVAQSLLQRREKGQKVPDVARAELF